MGKKVKSVLKYLKETLQHMLQLQKCNNLALIRFCNADWANDLKDQRSTSRSCTFLGSNLVSLSSRKQGVISQFRFAPTRSVDHWIKFDPMVDASSEHITFFLQKKCAKRPCFSKSGRQPDAPCGILVGVRISHSNFLMF